MLTDSELEGLRTLIEANGFLPVAGKAHAVLVEVERLTHIHGPAKTFALRELCEELESAGYLPKRKANDLLEAIATLRRG